MRIIESQQFHHNKPLKKRKYRLFRLLALAIGLVAVAWLFFIRSSESTDIQPLDSNQQVVDDTNNKPDELVDTQKDTLRQFSDNEFKVFYESLLQPNLLRVENPPVISGNDTADARIRKLAEDRGYRLRSSPSIELAGVDGYLLQPQMVGPWRALKAAAAKDGYSLSILSGYRSVESQRKLFLQRLAAAGASIEAVANGQADEIVNKVLVTSSIPGYSKHHTGYTFDLLCAGYEFENFKNSPCNGWLVADNYRHAKEHGFIPSYPPLASSQGPDPEAWEYVWVGTELLYE